MIEVNYNDYKKILEENMRLIPENHKLKEEVERLTKRLEESQLAFLQVDKDKQRLNNKLKDIKSQLDYLETYSSEKDVFEDMKRRLDRIDKIIGSDKEC